MQYGILYGAANQVMIGPTVNSQYSMQTVGPLKPNDFPYGLSLAPINTFSWDTETLITKTFIAMFDNP